MSRRCRQRCSSGSGTHSSSPPPACLVPPHIHTRRTGATHLRRQRLGLPPVHVRRPTARGHASLRQGDGHTQAADLARQLLKLRLRPAALVAQLLQACFMLQLRVEAARGRERGGGGEAECTTGRQAGSQDGRQDGSPRSAAAALPPPVRTMSGCLSGPICCRAWPMVRAAFSGLARFDGRSPTAAGGTGRGAPAASAACCLFSSSRRRCSAACSSCTCGRDQGAGWDTSRVSRGVHRRCVCARGADAAAAAPPSLPRAGPCPRTALRPPPTCRSISRFCRSAAAASAAASAARTAAPSLFRASLSVMKAWGTCGAEAGAG